MRRLPLFAAGAVAGALVGVGALVLWIGWLGLTEDLDHPHV